jgi:hypothetical protein
MSPQKVNINTVFKGKNLAMSIFASQKAIFSMFLAEKTIFGGNGHFFFLFQKSFFSNKINNALAL